MKEDQVYIEVEFFDKEKTILEQMFEKNIFQPYGCLSGTCGVCKLKKPEKGFLVEIGDPIAYIKNDMFLPCISKISDKEKSITIRVKKKYKK